MLRGGAEPGAVHGADHHRGHGLAAEHVLELGGLVEDLVEADPHEVDEHQFGHRPQPGRGGTHGGADEAALGDRRVQHAVAAEPGHQSLGDAQRAAPGIVLAGRTEPAGHVLAHDDDAVVALHLLAEGLVDRLTVALLGHGPGLSRRRRRR